MKGRRWNRWRYKLREYGTGYVFLLPWLVGFCAFMAFPIGWSFYLSFNTVNISPSGFVYQFTGLSNFHYALFVDNQYVPEMVGFFLQLILMVPIILVFSLLISLLLNQRFKGRFFFRALFFLPVIFSTGQIITEFFNAGVGSLPGTGGQAVGASVSSQYDIVQVLLHVLPPILSGPVQTVFSMIIIILWYSGVQILLFVAAYQTIPRSVYEAVTIDGASPWASFWTITLPALAPFVGLNALYTMVDLFTFPFNPITGLIQQNMFNSMTGYGYASALAWLYFLVIAVFTAFILWVLARSTRVRRSYS